MIEHNQQSDTTLLKIAYPTGFIEYVVAWGYDTQADSWVNGKYFDNLVEATEWFNLSTR